MPRPKQTVRDGPRQERTRSKCTVRKHRGRHSDDLPKPTVVKQRHSHARKSGKAYEPDRCLICRRQHTILSELRRARRPRDANVQIQSAIGDKLTSIKDKVKDKFSSKDKPDGKAAKDSKKKSPEDDYIIPKNPVVFCHGLCGFDTVKFGIPAIPFKVQYWGGVKKKFAEKGVDFLMTEVPPTSGTHDRAMALVKQIEAKYAGKSVHLIGHSMGGIDCRYLVSHIKPKTFKVLSITTIGSPHKGSSFADFILENLGKAVPALMKFLKWLPIMKGDGKAIECLSVKYMEEFNKTTPDMPGIPYFSWGAEVEPGLSNIFKFPHSIVKKKEGANDGMVSLHSAKWGKYQGTLENVDHVDLIGWVNRVKRKLAEVVGRKTEFEPKMFYFKVLDQLAREVENKNLKAATPAATTPKTTAAPKK